MVPIHPVIDKDQFRVGIRFISQTVLGLCPRRFKGDLLSAFAVQSETRTKVSVEFEGTLTFLQFRYFFIGLSKHVVCGLGR